MKEPKEYLGVMLTSGEKILMDFKYLINNIVINKIKQGKLIIKSIKSIILNSLMIYYGRLKTNKILINMDY